MQKSYKFSAIAGYILLALFLSMPLTLFSQGRYGISLSEGSLQCLSSRGGKLYQGIDNYILVDSSLYKECENIELISSNGISVKDTGNLYLLIPERAGKLRLAASCQNGGATEIKGYRYFNVMNVPDPQLMLNGIPVPNQAEIPRSALLRSDSISVFFDDDLVGSSEWMIITEFQLGYNYGGFHVSHVNPGNQLSIETKEIIARLGPDHEISIRATVKSLGDIKKQLPIYRIRIY